MGPLMAAGIGAALGGGLGLLGRDSRETLNTAGGGSSRGQSSFTPADAAAPMYGYVSGIGQQMGQTPTPYFPGMGYVGPSPLTQLGVQGMQGLGMQSYGNYGFLSNAADVANNPYVQNMLSANRGEVQDKLMQDVLPGIAGGASQIGMLGSSADALMRGRAIGDAATGLSRTNANMMLGAYGQGLGAQQNALGMTGNLMSAYGMPGQVVEGYQDRALRDAMARYGYQYQEPWQRMGNIGQAMELLSPIGQQNTSGSNMTVNSAPNANYQSPMMGMAQGALGGGMIGYGYGQPQTQGPGAAYTSAMAQNPANFGTFNAHMPWYGR